jgi:hypothetical protein
MMLNKCFFVVIKRHAFIVESSFKPGHNHLQFPPWIIFTSCLIRGMVRLKSLVVDIQF